MDRLPPSGPAPIPLDVGDVLRLRKPHACGGDQWLVDRLGADIGITCRSCGRHVLMDRRALERRLSEMVEHATIVEGNRSAPPGRLPGPSR